MILNPSTIDYNVGRVMAIVNLTPDSFYSVSRVMEHHHVALRIEQAIAEGASIVDLGAYSTRPGAEDVALEEEWQRLSVGLEAARSVDSGVVVSIDTFRHEIARRAIESYGAVVVNDISAGEMDDEMIDVVARYDVPYVAMHMRGTPSTMTALTDYPEGVVAAVVDYFRGRVAQLEARGVKRGNIILDPGFGFAKSIDQNFELLKGLDRLSALDYPVLAGLSRKSMIYKSLDITPEEALPGSLAMAWECLRGGATILRVHDVAATRQIVDLFNCYNRVL